MNRLQESLRRERAIKQVAAEEWELDHGKHGDIRGNHHWDGCTADQKKAAIILASRTIERYEKALEAQA